MEFALVVLLCSSAPGARCSAAHYETIAYQQGPLSRVECNAIAMQVMQKLPTPPDGRVYFGSCMSDDLRRKLAAEHI